MQNDLLTPKNAAQKLDVSTRTLRRWKNHGIITPVPHSSGKTLYHPNDIKNAKAQKFNPLPPKGSNSTPSHASTNTLGGPPPLTPLQSTPPKSIAIPTPPTKSAQHKAVVENKSTTPAKPPSIAPPPLTPPMPNPIPKKNTTNPISTAQPLPTSATPTPTPISANTLNESSSNTPATKSSSTPPITPENKPNFPSPIQESPDMKTQEEKEKAETSKPPEKNNLKPIKKPKKDQSGWKYAGIFAVLALFLIGGILLMNTLLNPDLTTDNRSDASSGNTNTSQTTTSNHTATVAGPGGENGSFLGGKITVGNSTGSLSSLDELGNLNISGDINIGGRLNLAPQTPPKNPKAGDQYFNATTKNMYYFNGSDWIDLSEGGSGAGSLQAAYEGGNTIETTQGDLSFIMAESSDGDGDFLISLKGSNSEFVVEGGTNQTLISIDDDALYPIDITQATRVSGNLYANKFIDTESATYYIDPANITTSAYLGGGISIGGPLTFEKYDETLSNSIDDFVTSSKGLSVGGTNTHYFDKSGNINAYTLSLESDLDANGKVYLGDGGDEVNINGSSVYLNTSGHVDLKPDSDGDDFFYFTTSSNNPSMLAEGISATNDPGIRVNATSGQLEYRDEDNATWTTIDSLGGTSTLLTDSGSIVYLTTATRDFVVGGSSLAAPFSVDESTNTVRIGEGSGSNATLSLYASDADTGSLTYNTSDTFAFSGGDVSMTGNLAVTGDISGADFTTTGTTTLNSVAYTWPGSDGTSGYVLSTDGSGTMSWASVLSDSPSVGGWTHTDHTLYPDEYWTDDLIIGGNSTASATFRVAADGTLDLGTNTIADGAFAGNWTFGGGNVSGVQNFEAAGTSDLQGNVSDSLGDFTIADNLVVTGTSDLQGDISDSVGNLVLADTLDLGSATTGLNVTTAGLITDTDGNIVLGDTIDLGSATTGLNITTAGVISDIDGDISLNDNVTFAGTTTLNSVAYTWPGADGTSGYALTTNGSGTLSWTDTAGSTPNWTHIDHAVYPNDYWADDLIIGGNSTASATFQVTAAGNMITTGTSDLQGDISDSVGNLVLADTIDLGSATTGLNITTAGLITDIDGNIVLGDIIDLGSATTGINITTAGAISDTDGNISLNDSTDITGSLTGTVNLDFEGTLTSGTSNAFQIDANGRITYIDSVAHTIDDVSGDLTFTSNSTTIDLLDNISVTGNIVTTGNLTIPGTTTLNTVSYTWPGVDGSSSYVLSTNGSGTLSWVDVNAAASSSIYWLQTNGATYPKNSTTDLFIGGTASASAKFAVLNVSSGTPTASISGTTADVATYLTGEGNLATTNNAPLTIGGTTTGSVNIDENTTITGTLDLTTGNTYQINTTDVLSATTLGTGVITSSLTTVGALGSGSISSGFGNIDIGSSNLDADGTITFAGLATDGIVTVSSGILSSVTEGGGGGLDADTLDTLHAASFLRSDASDEFETGNTLTLTGTLDSNGDISFADTDISFDGASTTFTTTGNFAINATQLFIDQSYGGIGIGHATPEGLLDVEGAAIGKALAILNETGDQNIFTASASGTTVVNITRTGEIQSADLLLGLNDATATISTNDTDENLTLDPNGAGDIYFHGATYQLSDTGDLTLGGRATFENSEIIQNETDDILAFLGSGGTDDTDFYLNLDGAYPILYSNTDTSIAIDDDLTFIGAQQITTSTGDLTLASAGNLILNTTGDTIDIDDGILDFSTQTVDFTLNDGVDALNFDTNTLSIDALNNKVAIGNAAPVAKLDVSGAVIGKALVILDETGDQDIFTASASGTTRFRIGTDGYTHAQRFSDIANGDYYLDPAAATSLFVSGNITSDGAFTISSNGDNNITIDAGTGTVIIGDGTNKLDAGTVDPPYMINGEKYATFLSGMIGVKEETTDTINTTEYIPGVGYRHTIDFTSQAKGSDVWLFAETTDLRKNIDRLAVLLSPAGNTRAWYELNTRDYLLHIYTTSPTQVSYRLTAPRFDAEKWTNQRDSESLGFQLNNDGTWATNESGELIGTTNSLDNISITPVENVIASTNEAISFQLTNAAGDIIESIATFSQVYIANLRAGFIEAQRIVTTDLVVDGQDIADYISSIVQSGLSDGSIISPSGSLSGPQLEGLQNDITANKSVIASQGEAISDLDTKYKILDTTSTSLEDRVASISTQTHNNTENVSSHSARLAKLEKISDTQSDQLEKLREVSNASLALDKQTLDVSGLLPDPTLEGSSELEITVIASDSMAISIDDLLDQYASISSTLADTTFGTPYYASVSGDLIASSIQADFLQVNTAAIQETAVIADSLMLTDNSLQIIDNQTLFIQPAGGNINLAAGLLTLDSFGSTVTVNGNFKVNGTIAATDVEIENNLRVKGVITASTLEAIDGELLDIKLATSSALAIYQDLGGEVYPDGTRRASATITATGSATFAELSLPETSGKSTLLSGDQNIIISAKKVTKESQVFVTFSGDYSPATKHWVTTDWREDTFTVHLNYPTLEDVDISWLIIN